MFFAKNKNFSKMAVAVYILFLLTLVLLSWIYWADMHFAFKVVVVVLEIFLLPDLSAIRDVFRDKGN